VPGTVTVLDDCAITQTPARTINKQGSKNEASILD